MPNQKVATDFDQIIQADRQRKKNEELAKEIFGKSKPSDASRRRDTKKQTATAPSLASRIGISKRSSSASGNVSPRNPPSRPSSATAQHARQNRLAAEIHNEQHANIAIAKSTGPGLSIKGSAAPFVVEARNFAPGTSDADIVSAFEPDCLDANGVNVLVSCKTIATKPRVSVELVFNDRSIAESIIAKYHNQIADGQTLLLRLARSGPGSMSKQHNQKSKPEPVAAPITIPVVNAEVTEDVEMDQQDVAIDTYDQEREAAERGRKDRDSRREMDDYDSSKHRGDDPRERDEDNRDQDRRRERTYERKDRDERSSYHRDEAGNGSRGSHYGNGVGGPGRPSHGGTYAGGRGSYPGYGGYSGRFGYRGGYRGYR